jgi:hypothetical protein
VVVWAWAPIHAAENNARVRKLAIQLFRRKVFMGDSFSIIPVISSGRNAMNAQLRPIALRKEQLAERSNSLSADTNVKAKKA